MPIEGNIDAKNFIGRKPLIDQIFLDVGCGEYTEMKECIQNEGAWRATSN